MLTGAQQPLGGEKAQGGGFCWPPRGSERSQRPFLCRTPSSPETSPLPPGSRPIPGCTHRWDACPWGEKARTDMGFLARGLTAQTTSSKGRRWRWVPPGPWAWGCILSGLSAEREEEEAQPSAA